MNPENAKTKEVEEIGANDENISVPPSPPELEQAEPHVSQSLVSDKQQLILTSVADDNMQLLPEGVQLLLRETAKSHTCGREMKFRLILDGAIHIVKFNRSGCIVIETQLHGFKYGVSSNMRIAFENEDDDSDPTDAYLLQVLRLEELLPQIDTDHSTQIQLERPPIFLKAIPMPFVMWHPDGPILTSEMRKLVCALTADNNPALNIRYGELKCGNALVVDKGEQPLRMVCGTESFKTGSDDDDAKPLKDMEMEELNADGEKKLNMNKLLEVQEEMEKNLKICDELNSTEANGMISATVAALEKNLEDYVEAGKEKDSESEANAMGGAEK